ncbi:uncharacterized protein LOC111634762 [Centruroides sculpturatus]|uniref:uncharacterized protein LOC111634762 n=1 Tax=Centruroides sculpturatus TaxID=218467 RepID=UPI000C6EA6DD|nr:uncharacterized protein LOC111634762 [Centruroides sculpturatus]
MQNMGEIGRIKRKGLLAHAKTRKHGEKIRKSAKSNEKLPFEPVIGTETKIAELKLSAFVAEHSNINTVNNLTELLPKIDEKPKIIGELKLLRTKCSMQLKNVIGPSVIEELIQDMDNSPFSVIIDESTDISTIKILCIMVKYFSRMKKKNLILSQPIIASFNWKILRDDVSSLVVIRCVCHSLHLCAEKACQTLPRQLECLVREAHNWFSYSSTRKIQYESLFAAMNENSKPKKISKLSGTRWLRSYQDHCRSVGGITFIVWISKGTR